MSWDEIIPSGGPEIMSCVDEPRPLTLRPRPEMQASMIRRYEPRVPRRGYGEWPAGATLGALLVRRYFST
jgi:hypothetical protein